MDYHTQVVKYNPHKGLSPELATALFGTTIPHSSIERMDVAFGNLTNGITGISRAVMRLTKLEQLFIANSPITADKFLVDVSPESPFYEEQDEWSWQNFELLCDVEIYNCSKLERLPIEMLTQLPNIISLNVAMNQAISGEQLKSDWEAIIDGESGGDIQILYLGFNNLKETPSYDYLSRMHKLSYLDCTYNSLEVVHPFGKEISPATLLYDGNRIREIHTAEDGYFCGLSMMETFSCSNNLLTELPDLFTARSVYGMLTTDFSSNRISSLENGDAWRGVNTGTLNLANNRFEELPARIIKSGSAIEVLMLSANGMRHIAGGALTGENSEMLTTIDLSYNRLSELPYADFSISNIPFLYGIDLSYNAFSDFPYAPLSIDRLTIMSIRHQRDDEGNRVLREWPTGLYTHPTLAAFYIGSNDLRRIDDSISPYILLFEIKDNPNISIDLSEVCPYIELGYYELIYDPWQDIRGCDALNLD
jgi:Leucine-rich repeat (LRR) protein